MQPKELPQPCESGTECGYIAAERNRYFTGKFMTARDFSGEQEYFLSRHRLHTRLLHGWGIVCGLRVVEHPRADCKDWVVVRSGIAIDCCGREIILCKDTAFRLPLATNDEEAAAAGETRMTEPFLLCIRYAEEEIERVPALYAEGECDPTRREANRVREVARLEVRRLEEVESGCWSQPGGDMEAPCRDDCDDDLPGPAGTCLKPECPCGEVVPLVLIRPKEPERGYAEGFEMDDSGRRDLRTPAEFLTHISGINWRHGERIPLQELRETMGCQLIVTFDRKLQERDQEKTGINACTFVVQYAGVQQDLEFLPQDPDRPPELAEDQYRAVFTIDPRAAHNLADNVIYITLKCDFILDCHGNPVDGNHLAGRLPSGDGIAGGVFESWFRVVRDDEERQYGKSQRNRAQDRTRA
jgi:hypothetical protein